MADKKFNKTVIVGTGLLGGSIGLILRQKKISKSIVGVARHIETLEKAVAKKAIDYGTIDLKEALVGADLIILAAPVKAIEKIITQLKGRVAKGCIITDVGSTKSEIIKHAQKTLSSDVFFVGVHPMAGSEKSGIEYATEDLFVDSNCFICQTKKTKKSALKKVRNLWKQLGANIWIIDPVKHDKIVAQISHLPHLVAAALVDSVDKNVLKFAATGFKSVTRIASGGPDIWRDISFSNRKEIISSIGVFQEKLQQMKKTLLKKNETVFTKQLGVAKKKRDSILSKVSRKAEK